PPASITRVLAPTTFWISASLPTRRKTPSRMATAWTVDIFASSVTILPLRITRSAGPFAPGPCAPTPSLDISHKHAPANNRKQTTQVWFFMARISFLRNLLDVAKWKRPLTPFPPRRCDSHFSVPPTREGAISTDIAFHEQACSLSILGSDIPGHSGIRRH